MQRFEARGAQVEQDFARIEQFLDALWLERNLAENTLSAYRRDLQGLWNGYIIRAVAGKRAGG
jgi:site-specific recombinase XerD